MSSPLAAVILSLATLGAEPPAARPAKPQSPFRERGYYITFMRMPNYDLAAWTRIVDGIADDGGNLLLLWMGGAFRSKKFPITWQYNAEHENVRRDFVRQLIDAAHRRGVRVLLAFTPFGYDGVNHYPKEHPELRAVGADGKPVGLCGIGCWGYNLCPSKAESQRFMLEYVREMFFDFYPNADGLMIESSDYAICHCRDCGPRFFQQEHRFVRQISDEVWARRPEAMILVYPHYFSGAEVPGFGVRGAKLPWDDRWTLFFTPHSAYMDAALIRRARSSVWWDVAPALQRPQDVQNGARRAKAAGVTGYVPSLEAYSFVATEAEEGQPWLRGRRQVPLGFGWLKPQEPPYDELPMRVNRIAYREFTRNPDLPWEQFLQILGREVFGERATPQHTADLLDLQAIFALDRSWCQPSPIVCPQRVLAMNQQGQLSDATRKEFTAALTRLRAMESRYQNGVSAAERQLARIARWVLDQWTDADRAVLAEQSKPAAKPAWASVALPNATEMDVCRRWIADRFGSPRPKADALPFSFVYAGKPSAQWLAAWKCEVREESVDAARVRRTYVYTDPASCLQVRCVMVSYRDYPAVEWTLYFKNAGSATAAVLEGVRALDVEFRRGAGTEFLLHHNVGSPCEARDYAPLETPLTAGAEKRIGAAGGRSTNSDLSYFNLACGDRGVMIALGWPGQWESLFARDREDGVRVRAGQQQLRVRLEPGEEIRSPLAALVFWQGGDWLRAQNLWRRWFITHNIRKPGGQLPPTHWCGASETGTEMMVGATEAIQKKYLGEYLARGLKPDFWWMDAGWYPCNGNWTVTGTWEPDKARFPRGFRPVTDALHAKGVKANLWFEPERVVAGTWLANERPQWIVGGKAGGLLNLGDPQCRRWLLEHIDRQLTEGGIDIFRQDFNMDPLPFWRRLDMPDRQGVAENRHCVGLLAFWDELLGRHPAMLYDNCASGGRRNDLECMRRGVPYTKSDYADDPVGVQGQTYGISMWLPYFAATWGSSDEPYLTRSRFAHTVGACLDLRQPNHFAHLPKRLDEWRKTVSCYWGDFWPLSPYSLDNAAWIAWQFDVPESGRGVVQAFRRAASPVESSRYKLRGLNPAARYRLVDLDRPGSTESTGRELMDNGLPITLAKRPAAAIVTYQRVE